MLANLKHPQNTLSAFGHFGQHLATFGNIWPFWAKFGQKKSQHIAVLGFFLMLNIRKKINTVKYLALLPDIRI